MSETLRKAAIFVGALSLVGVLSASVAVAEENHAKQSSDMVNAMTYNVHEGSDFNEIFAATNVPEFVTAVQTTLDSVNASKPPVRMKAVARQIAMNRPDLVGLQEVSTWRMGPPGNQTVLYDMLQELLDALNAQGQHYYPVVVVQEFQLAGPLPDGTNYLSVSDTDVILAKRGLHLSNVQSGNYKYQLSVPTFFGDVPVARGWGSVDLQLHNQSVRFIVTHLENVIPQMPQTLMLQEAQALELMKGPANTFLPVIIAGDFNANAADPNDLTYATYKLMTNSGYTDAWAATRPLNPGLTWQLVDSQSVDTAYQRIDYIFSRFAGTATVCVEGGSRQVRQGEGAMAIGPRRSERFA